MVHYNTHKFRVQTKSFRFLAGALSKGEKHTNLFNISLYYLEFLIVSGTILCFYIISIKNEMWKDGTKDENEQFHAIIHSNSIKAKK